LPWLRGAAGGRGPQRPRVVTEVRRRRPRAAEAEGYRRRPEDNDEDDRIGRKIARRVCSGEKSYRGGDSDPNNEWRRMESLLDVGFYCSCFKFS